MNGGTAGLLESEFRGGWDAVYTRGDITRLLEAYRREDPEAQERLILTVYNELHRIADDKMRGERIDHTLQATALVNEFFMRRLNRSIDLKDRNHFFRFAAKAMGEILIDHARAHRAKKRGGDRKRVPLFDPLVIPEKTADVWIDLETLLPRLEEHYPRHREVFEQHYFLGLSLVTIADTLGVSPKTVQRHWDFAVAWLADRLTREKPA